jgi:hypothetical protein
MGCFCAFYGIANKKKFTKPETVAQLAFKAK